LARLKAGITAQEIKLGSMRGYLILRLVITERARADLLEAWLYIAEDNLAAADQVLDN
jgi:plasmid stabilization system protein ParE